MMEYTHIKGIMHRLRGGIIPMMSANILNNVVNMLSSMIITRILTKPEYGIWSYTLNIYSYLNLITGLGLLAGAFQFGAENRGTEEEFRYYKYCLHKGLQVNTLIVTAFLGITFIIPFALPKATPFIRAITPLILLEYIMQLFLTIFRCQNRIKDYAGILNFNTIMLALGHCGGALIGVSGVLAGRYGAVLLSILLICIKAKPEISRLKAVSTFRNRDTADLWRYSIFTGSSSALNCLLYLLDVSMIAALLHNSEQVALYKVATLIPTALTFIPSSVVVCILPDIIRNRRDVLWLRKSVFCIYLGLGCCNLLVTAILFWGAPYVISILSGSKYLDAVIPFRILVCGYFVSGTFRVLSTNILAGLRKINYNLFLSVLSGVCDIVFNYFLITRLGMKGAALATFGTEIVISVLAFGYLCVSVYGGRHGQENHFVD